MNSIVMTLISIAALLVAAPSSVEADTLFTRTGGDIGLSLSSYKYQEPGVMSSKGTKLGLDVRAVKVLQDDRFVRGDLRYALGSVDYTGSGVASGQPDWYVEARGLVGKDWVVGAAVLAAYTGIGYRYLANDGRGISSAGAAGYRRESNYLYLPVGLIYRAALDKQARLVTEVEYDYLMTGKQVSRLSDAGLGYSDMTNSQAGGYGVKLGVRYEQDDWAVGPYAHYWNIGQSDSASLVRNGIPIGRGWEPANSTIEFGVKACQRF